MTKLVPRGFTYILLLALVTGPAAGVASAKLVACVGDSITYGAGISNRQYNSYPAQLGRILQEFDSRWESRNYGVSGATLLSNGDLPYVQQSAYQQARAAAPDVVIIKLGTNDSKPVNWAHMGEFISDYSSLIDVFAQLPSKPQIWICKPVPAFQDNWGITDAVIKNEVIPLIDEVAQLKGVPVIDLYTAMQGTGHLFPDGIHPNAEGAGMMAQIIAPIILGIRAIPDFDLDGNINLFDFCRLAQCWQQDESSLDISPAPDGDGVVSCTDLAGLATYWLRSPGLLAHWQLDESEGSIAHDSVAGKDGTVHGEPLWQPAGGKVGGAIELDGSNDYISTDFVLNPADGPFSVLAWVKGNVPGRTIIRQNDAGGQTWLGTEPSEGKLITRLTDSGRFTGTLGSSFVVTDGDWHHVRVVWDGSHRYLYADGVNVAEDIRALGALDASQGGLYLGAGKTRGEGSFWSGLIDDVRIYSRALNP